MIEYIMVGSVIGMGVLALIPITRMIAVKSPYAYPNARIRAMLGRFLNDEEVEELTRRPYNDVVYTLEQKSFPKLSRYLADDFSYAALEAALRTQLVLDLNKLKRISPQPVASFLRALIRKYDIQLIELFIRSHKLNVPRDMLHATELFPYEFIHKEHSLAALEKVLQNTPYLRIFRKHKSAIEEGAFKAFEEELDLFFFASLLHSAKTFEAKGYVRRLINAHNISLLVQGEEPIIPGAKTKEELKKLLEDKDALVVEREVYVEIKKYARGLLAKDPLSEAPIIAYAALATINVRNISILLKLKTEGFDAKEIVKVMV